MFDLPLISFGLRLLATVMALQLITAMSITISYKWRRRSKAQTGYNRITLEPLSMPEARLQIYMDGNSLFTDMATALEGAEFRIMFETFIWKNDALGRKFRDLVVKKAQEGVEVYVVYDLIGSWILGWSWIRFPKDIPTLHVARFFSLKRLHYVLSPSRYNVTHRKLLVLDDQIGFVGGYNIGEEYCAKWRDTHLGIQGPGVRDLAFAFIDFWNHYLGRHGELTYPKLKWTSIFDVHRNDPLRRNYPIRSVYLRAIERAQKYIYITNAYFVPDPAFREALIDAALRGVDVQVILPWESNHQVVDWVARHWFQDYLDAGIKLFGFETAMIHAKSVTIDGMWTTIGTANLDRLSLWLNHEINTEIYSEAVAEQMEAIFACDKRQTRQIKPTEWAKRPLTARLGERILAPLWPFV